MNFRSIEVELERSRTYRRGKPFTPSRLTWSTKLVCSAVLRVAKAAHVSERRNYLEFVA